MITHNLVKQNLIITIVILYLINSYYEEKYEWVFRYLSFYMTTIPFIALLISPTLSNIIERSWTYSTSFTVYYLGFIIIFCILRIKNMSYSYSLTLTTSLITASGWLYELPRYYRILGLEGLIRTNRDSIVRYDIGIIATILSILLLYKKNYKIKEYTLINIFLYIVYCICYYEPFLRVYRVSIGMYFYKIIMLMLLIGIVLGVKKDG